MILRILFLERGRKTKSHFHPNCELYPKIFQLDTLTYLHHQSNLHNIVPPPLLSKTNQCSSLVLAQHRPFTVDALKIFRSSGRRKRRRKRRRRRSQSCCFISGLFWCCLLWWSLQSSVGRLELQVLRFSSALLPPVHVVWR